MTTIAEDFAARDFNVSDAELIKMLEVKSTAGRVDYTFDDTYFKVLYTRWALEPGTNEGSPATTRLEALDKVAKPMKALVNKVYCTPDIAPNEEDTSEVKRAKTKKRQSVTKFADTAKAELKAAIENGMVDYLDCASKGAYQVANQEIRAAKRKNQTTDDIISTLLEHNSSIVSRLSGLNAGHSDAVHGAATVMIARLKDLL